MLYFNYIVTELNYIIDVKAENSLLLLSTVTVQPIYS